MYDSSHKSGKRHMTEVIELPKQEKNENAKIKVNVKVHEIIGS